MTATVTKIHKFEEAGLGRAPFRFIGVETGAERAAIQMERASSGMVYTTNNATSCDYCGQGIMNAYRVRSADGKDFKVGCDCIRKTGDSGLIKCVTEEEKAKRRAANRKRGEAKWQRECDLRDAFIGGKCESLRSMPHPKGREGCTAYDYVQWCVENHCFGQVAQQLVSKSI